MTEPHGSNEGISQEERKRAEHLVRGWNLLYNRCFSYAFAHPLVQETLPRVWELFRPEIQRCGTLNLQLLEAMYFVDRVDVMYQPTNRRIAEHLRRFRIESLSLGTDFSSRDFSVLVDACSLTHPDPSGFLRYYQSHGGEHLEVNQVTLRAVREGEADAGGATFGGLPTVRLPGGEIGGDDRFEDIILRAMIGRLTAQELEGNVALVQMLADPQSVGRAALDRSQSLAAPVRAEAVGQMVVNVLSHFASQQSRQGFSVEELLTGIYQMRQEMMELVRSQKNLDQGLQEDEVEATTDIAFDQTVCRIVLDEYRTSKGNARRVAQVIGRVVPGKKELRRILPRLKESFLSAGCPLPEWYGLVKELSAVVQGDKALEELATAASEMGVSPDEILSELRRDPRTAAKLIVVASEIRRSGGDPGSDASIQALLDSVDNAGDRISDAAREGNLDAAEAVRAYDRMQSEIRQEIGGREMSVEARRNALKKLDLRSHRTLSDLKARVLAQQLGDGEASLEVKAATLGELVKDESEIDGILELAFQMVGADDLTRQVGLQISERVKLRILEDREKAASRELPVGVYPKAVTEFFLRYEARRAARYAVPFSALLVSFQGLPEDKENLDAHSSGLRGLFNILLGDLRALLRDVDFVGSLGYNRVLVVLPMTVEENAMSVVRKIRERLGREVALPDEQRAWVRPRIGLSSFDHNGSDGLKEIMAKLSQNWQEDV